jgi:hypothetical protein
MVFHLILLSLIIHINFLSFIYLIQKFPIIIKVQVLITIRLLINLFILFHIIQPNFLNFCDDEDDDEKCPSS